MNAPLTRATSSMRVVMPAVVPPWRLEPPLVVDAGTDTFGRCGRPSEGALAAVMSDLNTDDIDRGCARGN